MSAAVVELYMENFTVFGMTESDDLRSRVVSWLLFMAITQMLCNWSL
jgi:hypothetical protein